MKKTIQKRIDKIKSFIQENPNSVLVKNKHKLNTAIIRNQYPILKDIPKETLEIITKDIVNFDRDVRKAKEELRNENKISISGDEKELLEILQQQKQLDYGY